MSDKQLKPKIGAADALEDIVSFAIFRVSRASVLLAESTSDEGVDGALTRFYAAEEALQFGAVIFESAERTVRGTNGASFRNVEALGRALKKLSDAAEDFRCPAF